MKILIASVGAPGHLNPLLAAGSILSQRHEVAVQVCKEFRPAVDKAGLRYLPEIPGVSTCGGEFMAKNLEFLTRTRGLNRIAFNMQNFFAKNIPIQAANLQFALSEFPADLILADSTYFGTLPLLLGPREDRPAIAHLGITVIDLHSGKNFPLRPDATAEEARNEKERHSHIVLQPVQAAFDSALGELGLGPLPHPALESLSLMADLYIHPGIPSFEYPGHAARVHYIGRLPMATSQTALPSWWPTLDRTKRLVLITQGTVANRDLSQVIGPALTGLGARDDLALLVTTGGQPASSIPVEIPRNAFVSEFLPFDEILPHIDLLITNGGYGTVNMALAHGVPIISGGVTEDKEVVSALVQRVGVGIDLRSEHAEPEAVRKAAVEILSNPNYKARAENLAREFASIDTAESLLALVSGAIHGRKHGTYAT